MKPELEQLEGELRNILKAELDAGNTVSGVTVDWPRRGRLSVQLKDRFKLEHATDGTTVIYAEDRDPHGSFAEYVDINTGQSLLCHLFP